MNDDNTVTKVRQAVRPKLDVTSAPDEVAVEPSSLMRGVGLLSKKSVTASTVTLPMISNVASNVALPKMPSVGRGPLLEAGLVTGLTVATVVEEVVGETVVGDFVGESAG